MFDPEGPGPDEWDDGDGAAGSTVWRVIHFRLAWWKWSISVHQ